MTTDPNPPARIDHDALSVSRTISIEAPVDKVWAAITEPEHIARWHATAATLSSLEPGGTGAWAFEGEGAIPIRVEAVDPPHSITYRWGPKAAPHLDPAVSTVFTFTLENVDGGTRLTVVETGFETLADPQAGLADNQDGWTVQLDALVTYVTASEVGD